MSWRLAWLITNEKPQGDRLKSWNRYLRDRRDFDGPQQMMEAVISSVVLGGTLLPEREAMAEPARRCRAAVEVPVPSVRCCRAGAWPRHSATAGWSAWAGLVQPSGWYNRRPGCYNRRGSYDPSAGLVQPSKLVQPAEVGKRELVQPMKSYDYWQLG